VRGYIGPQALARLGVRLLVDPLVVEGSGWVTGANEPGRHATDVVRGRDFVPDGEIGAVEIRDGDPCSRCGAPLVIARGIELGHVFQLGRRFADLFGLDVLGADGKPIRITMGSYGVGVSRAVAALAEQTLDESGLCWPREVAPADNHLLVAAMGEEASAAAEALAGDLDRRGVRVLFDDREGLSTGVRFKDAELLGVPTIVTMGRGLAQGTIEVKDRKSGNRSDLALADASGALAARCRIS
jgi:prolyl-tRNA synthetase